MSETASQQQRQTSLLLYSAQKEPLIDEILVGLNMPVVSVSTTGELIEKLDSASFGGLCIATAPGEVESLRNAFLDIENRAMLQGLRPVLLLLRSPSTTRDRVFQIFDKSWLQALALSAFRDVVEISRQPSALEREDALKRIAFAIQFNSKNPFANRFATTVRWRNRAQISVSGRLSWFDETSRQLCVECGSKLEAGLLIKIQLETSEGATVVSGIVKENHPAELRFNFGNSSIVELTEQSSQVLKRALRGDRSGAVVGKPMRRAFVITRSHAMRQRLVKLLSKNFIDSRIPLVKRNILTDLPLLAPHFVVFEDRVLRDIVEKEGPHIVHEIMRVAGHQARFAVVGDHAGDLSRISESISVIHEKPVFDNNVSGWLSLHEPGNSHTSETRHWFVQSARMASVSLSFDERIHAISADGIILRGHNQYRLWNNFEITLPGTRIQFIGKVTASLLACDAFKTKHHVTLHDHAVLTYVSCLTSSADLMRETAKGLESQLASINLDRTPPKTITLPRASVSKTPSVSVPARVSKPKSEVDWKKLMSTVYLFLFLLGLALILYVMVMVDSGGAGFSRSFRELFESRGR